MLNYKNNPQKERANFLNKYINKDALIIITNEGYLFLCPKLKKIKFKLDPMPEKEIDWEEFEVWTRIENTPTSQIINLHLNEKSIFFETI